MKITKNNHEIIIRIPLWQKSYDAIGQYQGNVNNLYGVIAGDEQGIHQANDLGYKGDVQVGGLLVDTTHLDEDEFRKLCDKLGISVVEYPRCIECKKIVYGATYNDKCLDCCED